MIEYVVSGRQILEMLKNRGYNSNKIAKEKLLSAVTMQRLREDKMISIESLGKVCDILEVQPHILVKNVTEIKEK